MTFPRDAGVSILSPFILRMTMFFNRHSCSCSFNSWTYMHCTFFSWFITCNIYREREREGEGPSNNIVGRDSLRWDKKPLWNRETGKLPLAGQAVEKIRRGNMLLTHLLMGFGKDPIPKKAWKILRSQHMMIWVSVVLLSISHLLMVVDMWRLLLFWCYFVMVPEWFHMTTF